MGVSEKRQNFHFGVEYPFKVIFTPGDSRRFAINL